MNKRILAAAMAALPWTAFGAETLGGDTVLPTVPVQATRLGVEQAAAVNSLGTGDTAAALSAAPGYSSYSAGGVSSLPVLRGLADDRIKILIDGAESTSACGNHMNAPLSYIDASQVASARVVAGITPVSLGGDSIAGTIEINSAPPLFAGAEGQWIQGGNFAIYGRSIDNGLTAALGLHAANDRLSLSYDITQSQADSYKDGKGNKVPDTLYKSTNQSFTIAAQGGGNRWTFRAGQQDIPYQGFPNQYMDMTKNRSVFANFGYDGDFAWGNLEGKVYWRDTRHKMDFFTDEKPGSMPMDTHGRDLGYTIKASIDLKDGDVLRLGHEYHSYKLDDWWPPVFIAGSMMQMMWPETYVNINDGKRDRFVLFAEWEGKLDKHWSSLLGIRSETVKTDAGTVKSYNCGMMCMDDDMAAAAFNASDRSKRDNNLDLTALLNYAPSETASYEFGYARKTRSPNLYERYTWGRGEMAMAMIGWFGDGNGYVGNPDLKPEVAHTLSASLDWHDADRQRWNLKVTPFYTRVKDFIDVDYLGAGMMVREYQFANHDAHLYGVNANWRAPLWNAAGYGSGVLTGKLDWTRGKRDDGGDLYHIMPLNLTLGVEQQAGSWTHRAEIIAVARKDDVDLRRVENVTSGYSLVNLSTRYQVSTGLSLQAGIRNLLDRQYALPLGGYNLAVSGTTPLYGQGRSLDLGLNWKF